MTISTWLLFLTISLLTTFSPGPGVLLAIANCATLGPRKALCSSLGNALGILMVAMLSVTVVGVLFKTSATAFLALRLAGGGYLILLGWRQCRKPSFAGAGAGAGTDAHQQAHAAVPPDQGGWQSVGQGLLVALTNPKSLMFFIALFPRFMGDENGGGARFMLLTATFATCAMLSHLTYIALARPVLRFMDSPRRARLFNGATGLLLIGLGLSMLTLQRHA
ncbi:LysE family translocator [Rugamonas apoptosis]|uniref:LysE family translocator n=1 Tax=Rugamonas apoptosis TaxID=2758570 RepID=A0A7W2FC73_9BURK|nr:LysE family translocator [Rugamonas apoptosis]MBA5689066.1 LysE family translocator [Rugamonas apoptosis]